jgi:hypothetical protein
MKKLVKLRGQPPLHQRSEEALEGLVKLRAQHPFEFGVSHEDLVKFRAQASLRTVQEGNYLLKNTSRLEGVQEAGTQAWLMGGDRPHLARAWLKTSLTRHRRPRGRETSLGNANELCSRDVVRNDGDYWPVGDRRGRLRGSRGRMRMLVCENTGPGYLTRAEATSSGRSGTVLARGGLMTHV